MSVEEKGGPSPKGVKRVPEPLLPSYRIRVPKPSTTYRSHSVKHVP